MASIFCTNIIRGPLCKENSCSSRYSVGKPARATFLLWLRTWRENRFDAMTSREIDPSQSDNLSKKNFTIALNFLWPVRVILFLFEEGALKRRRENVWLAFSRGKMMKESFWMTVFAVWLYKWPDKVICNAVRFAVEVPPSPPGPVPLPTASTELKRGEPPFAFTD